MFVLAMMLNVIVIKMSGFVYVKTYVNPLKNTSTIKKEVGGVSECFPIFF